MKLLLIQPSVGKIHGEKYVKSWTMEPLALSTLAGMTPDDIDIELIDERIDELPEIYKETDQVYHDFVNSFCESNDNQL